MKRKERYMGMFNGLGSSVRVNDTGQGAVDFEGAVTWAMKHLGKDDRIVWFLSIVQRAALMRLRNSGKWARRRIRRKIEDKLKHFGAERVEADFESGFMAKWPHYESLVKVYQLGRMKDYSFYTKKEKWLVPKTAAQVLKDHEEMDEQLQELAEGKRFCSDGKPFLEFEDGWTWFVIEGGWSSQEAKAMRHCGNGVGQEGDRLLSLREPIAKGDLVFWKPHLTFILHDVALGEMKGFANGKPEERFHPYVEGLLSRPEIREIRGGGYRPENNFAFPDMNSAGAKRVLETNPELKFDLFGDEGEVLIEADGLRWILAGNPQFPGRMAGAGYDTWSLQRKASDWIAFQTPIRTVGRTAWVTQAWCGLNKGKVSSLALMQEDSAQWIEDTASALLGLPCLERFSEGENPLSSDSNWGKALGIGGCCELMRSKPGYFRDCSLNDVWNVTGLSDAYLAVLNERFGLGFRKSPDGIELQRFDSPRSFARETRNQRYLKMIRGWDKDTLRQWLDTPPFEIPWLRLRSTENKDLESAVSLILTPEGTEVFFQIIDFQNIDDFQGIVPEISYRFGLRTGWEERLPQAA